MIIDIGWCITEELSSSIFFEPQSTQINHKKKSTNIKSEGVLRCPAVHNLAINRIFNIRSPYTIKLRAIETSENKIDIRGVFPDTEVDSSILPSIISVEPREFWIDKNIPILQIKMPYIFFSDIPVWINQLEAPSQKIIKSWSLIQGRFDIYSWQRSLNFATQWFDIKKDFYIKRGEPIFQICFDTTEASNEFKLKKVTLDENIKRRIASCEGVTKLIKNTGQLMSSNRDPNLKLLQ